MRYLALCLAAVLCSPLAVARAADLTLEGKVVDSSDKPVAGAHVVVWAAVRDRSSTHTFENRSERLAEDECVEPLTKAPPALRRRLYTALATGERLERAGETTANGSGEYRVKVVDELAGGSSFYVLAEDERGSGLSQGCEWTYLSEDRKVRPETITLAPCTRLAFRVTSKGKPVAGATITLRQPFSLGFRCGNCEAGFWRASTEWHVSRASAPTDEVESELHGTYRIATDADGRASFTAAGATSSFSLGGESRDYTLTVSRVGLGTVHRTLSLTATRSRDTVEEIELEPTASIAGTILDSANSPVADAAVTVFAIDSATSALHRAGSAKTDASGTFLFETLARGHYKLSVVSASEALEDATLDVEAPAPTQRIGLAAAGTLAVTVAVPADEDTLQSMRWHASAVGGVDVGLSLERQSGTSWEDVAHASFGFSPGSTIDVPATFGKLAPGTYRVRANGSPFAITFSKTVTVQRSVSQTLSLELDPGRRVEGHIVDPDGKRIAKSVSCTLKVEGRWIYSLFGGKDDGSFSMHEVPHMPVQVEIEAKGYKKVVRDVDAKTTDLGDVVLEPESKSSK